MNISDLNKKIYRYKDLKQGEYADLIMSSIENQDVTNFNVSNFNKENFNDRINEINKEIKF